MKHLFIAAMALFFSTGILFAGIPGQLEIGAGIPNAEQEMKEVGGTSISLDMAKGENGLLVMFSCNTCPYVLAWQDRYYEIAETCEANGVGLILVNSNEARRSGSDSFEAMQEHAEENNYSFSYTLDQNHELADAFGAKKTPDVFLFDSESKLVYKGAIDDNHKSAKHVKEPFLQNALASMKAGNEIKPNTTLAIGCSIKRVQ